MTPAEFAEWAAYSDLEPFGSPVEDDRFRHVLSLFYSANSKAGSKQPIWLDRDPEETARLESLITLEDKIEGFLGGLATAATGTIVVDEVDK